MLHVVTGAPASGKTTFVAHNAKPGDIRIDLDHIANLITGADMGNHEHEPHVITVARAGRAAMIETILNICDTHDVWVIDTDPSPQRHTQYTNAGAQFHTINPGKNIVMKRCKESRPRGSTIKAAEWFDKHDAQAQTKATRRRKYGQSHRRLSERMRRHMKDGTLCSWCGHPMTRDMELHADHDDPTKPAGELLHAACNEQKGDGRNNHRRPALGLPDSLPALPIRYKKGHEPGSKTDETAGQVDVFMKNIYKQCP